MKKKRKKIPHLKKEDKVNFFIKSEKKKKNKRYKKRYYIKFKQFCINTTKKIISYKLKFIKKYQNISYILYISIRASILYNCYIKYILLSNSKRI